jgi:predicted DNA-binding protein with PD1-like motif
MSGATHSHDPEFPDDNWNLYSMLDTTTTALNVTKPQDAVGVFKPFARRLSPQPELISDADAEIIIVARFTSPVHIRKIMVIGGREEDHHPSVLRCYANQEGVDFTSVGALNPAQQFNLPINKEGVVEFNTALQPFTNVTSLAFYFPSNHGDVDATVIQYIGLQGEHTHYRREAVNTTYEVLCNGQDIAQPEDQLGAHAPHMH